MADRVGGFNESSARRIAKTVKRVEAMPVNPGTGKRAPRLSGGGTPGYIAVLTQDLNRHSNAEAAVYAIDGDLEEDTGERITVRDYVLEEGGGMAVGTRIITGAFNGLQYVIQAECTPSETIVSSMLSAISGASGGPPPFTTPDGLPPGPVMNLNPGPSLGGVLANP